MLEGIICKIPLKSRREIFSKKFNVNGALTPHQLSREYFRFLFFFLILSISTIRVLSLQTVCNLVTDGSFSNKLLEFLAAWFIPMNRTAVFPFDGQRLCAAEKKLFLHRRKGTARKS